jgi:hypothetical protein
VRVRVRVEDRIRRRAPWKIAALVAAFATLVIAALVIQMRPAIRKAANPPVAARNQPDMPSPPAEARAEEEPNQPVTVRPAVERKALKPRPAPRAQPVSIRIETPDPNVVILLVSQ